MSKTAVSSRIPHFKSRIPQIPQKTYEISSKHIGSRVKIGDKEGVLKFVGPVNFSKGTWCGVELSCEIGKNDGSVNGVRYFTCPQRCGLMAPLCKITLLEANCEKLDEDSGPYSMLFLENCSTKSSLKEGTKKAADGVLNCTETLVSEDTFVLDKDDKSRHIVNKEVFNETFAFGKDHDNITFFAEDSDDLNQTAILIKPAQLDETLVLTKQDTFEIKNCEVENNLKRKTFTTDNKEYFNSNKEQTFYIESAKQLIPNNEIQNTFLINKTYEVDIINREPNRTCEDLANFGAKRRKINNQKTCDNVTADDQTFSSSSPLQQSTPTKSEIPKFDLKKIRLSLINLETNLNLEDDKSKRDSLEFEESLEILTPDQMIEDYVAHLKLGFESVANEEESSIAKDFDGSCCTNKTRRGSSGKHTNKLKFTGDAFFKFKKPNDKESDIQSPNLVDASVTECSLGILDEHMFSNMSAVPDTMSLLLPLENVTTAKDYRLSRIEQTPSPEDLPLDPTPIAVQGELKEDAKNKPPNSFITSITSITSLDTGYQGDGEMSRPASRGADNSPMTRRPLPKPQNHRQDPMTDSDFYTESDADNHEEHPLKGDRKAQVIDGTLYGVDAQAAADIYANNRENMDSSGIFTDVESNTRAEDLIQTFDASPSDTSSKTVSENSQNNAQVKSSKGKNVQSTPSKETSKKRVIVTPAASSPTNMQSPKTVDKNETPIKKYKMPKRDVASKVKAMIVPNQSPASNDKKTVKKTPGRWDAVMDKISKNEQNKSNLKDVKSKVFKVSVTQSENNKTIETNKLNLRQNVNSKTPNTKLPDVKRVLTEKQLSNQGNKIIAKRNIDNGLKKSINKTLTDIQPKVYQISGLKKYKTIELNKVTSNSSNDHLNNIKSKVSQNNVPKNETKTHSTVNLKRKLHTPTSTQLDLRRTRTRTSNVSNSPRNNINLESSINSSLSDVSSPAQLSKKNNEKKKLINPTNDAKTKKYISPKEKKPESPKISDNRNNVKPGRQLIVGPSKRSQTAFKEDHRIVEALAILVQHLVFNVEAFSVPTLKKEIQISRLETEEWKKSYHKLEESINEEKSKHQQALDEERLLHKKATECLIENQNSITLELRNKHQELENNFNLEKEKATIHLRKQHDKQLSTLKKEFSKLQKNYEETLDILREENEAIREQIEEKKLEIEDVKKDTNKIKKEYEVKEFQLKEKVHLIDEENRKLVKRTETLEQEIIKKTEAVTEENKRLREENDRLLSYGDEKSIGLQEVQSLRAVLDLKQTEVAELRKALAEATQRLDILKTAEERANTLHAKCEDLETQLQRKQEYEQSLMNENFKLQESFKEEIKQKSRLTQHNEELQWKLKQNKEVINNILEMTGEPSLNRSLLNSSLNEKHSASRQSLERSLSFREPWHSNDSSRSRRYKTSQDFDEDDSPPSSPKVKGVVEKSDSVSYVLDLDESPDIVASRIVRRSFRNSTPPKTTPTKSPTNKTSGKHALSLSSSTSSVASGKSYSKSDPFSECQLRNNGFSWTSTPRVNADMKLVDNSDLDEDNYVDIQLPALPSELNRQSSIQALPSPKHLAGEAMISESASEDESTSSSQL